MTLSTGRKKVHFKFTHPSNQKIKPFGEWLPENRRLHADYCSWLKRGCYGASAVHIYCVGARLALGLIDKPIDQIVIETDLQTVRAFLDTTPLAPTTKNGYRKGLNKLAQYLRMQKDLPEPENTVNWGGYLNGVPSWLAEHLRAYIGERARGWQADSRVQLTRDLLSRLCLYFRAVQPAGVQDITPRSWFSFLGDRVKAGLEPNGSNLILRILQSFLRFLHDAGQFMDVRMLNIRPQRTGKRSPRDVPVPELKVVLKAAADPFDQGWLLLMLHAGLRTCEIRRLKWLNMDLERRTIRIEQSKKLKSRVVFITQPVIDALKSLPKVSDFIFSRYHRHLSRSYCQSRLETIGNSCGVRITPHQLRHSAATLLLNAGMSIWGVKEILGHRSVETTLGYARTYDSTMGREYYKAINRSQGPSLHPKDPIIG
jgi:integrase